MSEPDPTSPQPMLRGEKVWLRAIEPSELIEGAQLLSDAEIAHFTGFKAPLSRAGAERFANKVMEQGGRNPTLFVFGIVPLGEQTRIGNVSLRDVNQLNGSAELAIVVSARAGWARAMAPMSSTPSSTSASASCVWNGSSSGSSTTTREPSDPTRSPASRPMRSNATHASTVVCTTTCW